MQLKVQLVNGPIVDDTTSPRNLQNRQDPKKPYNVIKNRQSFKTVKSRIIEPSLEKVETEAPTLQFCVGLKPNNQNLKLSLAGHNSVAMSSYNPDLKGSDQLLQFKQS